MNTRIHSIMMADLTTAAAIVTGIGAIVENLPVLVENAGKVCTQATNCAEKIIDCSQALKDSKIKLSYKTKATQGAVVHLVIQAKSFMVEVVSLCKSGLKTDHYDRIKEEIKSNSRSDYHYLSSYIVYLTYQLSRISDSYALYREKCDQTRNSCMETAEESALLKSKANTKKHVTKAVGGAASATTMAVGIGGGVAASVVAGVLTFGVGAIIGLSITAASSIVGGVAIGTGMAVGTHCLATDFEITENAFKALKECLDFSDRTVGKLDEEIRKISFLLERIKKQLGCVDAMKQQHKDVLLDALETLWAEFDKNKEKVTNYEQSLAESKQRLASATQDE